jgi:hypothetical protein
MADFPVSWQPSLIVISFRIRVEDQSNQTFAIRGDVNYIDRHERILLGILWLGELVRLVAGVNKVENSTFVNGKCNNIERAGDVFIKYPVDMVLYQFTAHFCVSLQCFGKIRWPHTSEKQYRAERLESPCRRGGTSLQKWSRAMWLSDRGFMRRRYMYCSSNSLVRKEKVHRQVSMTDTARRDWWINFDWIHQPDTLSLHSCPVILY